MKFEKCHICANCNGKGYNVDPKTGNDIPCLVCNGSGHICEEEKW